MLLAKHQFFVTNEYSATRLIFHWFIDILIRLTWNLLKLTQQNSYVLLSLSHTATSAHVLVRGDPLKILYFFHILNRSIVSAPGNRDRRDQSHSDLLPAVSCRTHCTGYRSGNVWNLSCRCWCLTVCITWHLAICLPCASRSTLINAGRRHLRSAARGDLAVPATRTLRYGPRSFAMAGPSTWYSLPTPLHSWHLISSWFENRTAYQSLSLAHSWLFLAVRAGEHNSPTHHHHHQFIIIIIVPDHLSGRSALHEDNSERG